METLHCPTCLSRLVDDRETRCPACRAPISRNARPLSLLERELQARIEAKTAAHHRERRRAAKAARRIASLPPTFFQTDTVSTPPSSPPPPPPPSTGCGSSVIVDIPAAAVHAVRSTNGYAAEVAESVDEVHTGDVFGEVEPGTPKGRWRRRGATERRVEAPPRVLFVEEKPEMVVDDVKPVAPEPAPVAEPVAAPAPSVAPPAPSVAPPEAELPVAPTASEPAFGSEPVAPKARKRIRIVERMAERVAERVTERVTEPRPERAVRSDPKPVVEPARKRVAARSPEPEAEPPVERVVVPATKPDVERPRPQVVERVAVSPAEPVPIARIGTQGTNQVWRDRVFNSGQRPAERAVWPRARPQPPRPVAPVIDLPSEPVVDRRGEAAG